MAIVIDNSKFQRVAPFPNVRLDVTDAKGGKMRFRLAFVAAACVAASMTDSIASAQPTMDQLKGSWTGAAAGSPCGQTIIQIALIEASGIVRGVLDCTLRRITLTLGDKKELDKAMIAKLAGNRLTIDGANSSMDLTYENGQLVGFAIAGQGKRPISFTKR